MWKIPNIIFKDKYNALDNIVSMIFLMNGGLKVPVFSKRCVEKLFN